MKRLLALGLVAACGADGGPRVEPAPLESVDPFIGSGGFGFHHGSAFAGASAPHGLAKVGADTEGPFGTITFLHYSGYWYGDDTILGFSHLHLHGAGATDYGVLALMPTEGGVKSRFDKSTEVSRPGYYAVTLDEGGVRVEIAATPHAAHHRYTGARAVKLDLDHHLSGTVETPEVTALEDGQGFRGRLRSIGDMSDGFGGYDVFFEGRTRAPFTAEPVEDGLVMRFAGADPVEIRIGISLVDAEGAAANLAAELPAFDLDATRAATEAAWAERLGRVRISGGTGEERRIFYSALYRAFLMPTWVGDVDGRWRAPDGTIVSADWRQLTDLSLWDTYRTLHPLYALAWPEAAADSVRSLHEFARVAGFFPKWPIATGEAGTMIGASAEVVIADAVLKDAAGALDAEGAYQTLRAAAIDATAPAAGRGGRYEVEGYLDAGWLPATVDRSVSKTVEFAQDDAALAGLAAALGHDADAALLEARSHGWRNLFDPASGFLRARSLDGGFADEPFEALDFGAAYAEGNAWHSSFPAHDAPQLAEAHGGETALVARLEQLFENARQEWESADPTSIPFQSSPRPYYWHGNEPDIHAAWLFAQLGRPDLTERWVRWVMDVQYRAGPDGLPGNDDGGTLSAWWVFAALGLYPIAGTDRYVLGMPRFARAELDVPGGVFTIVAEGEGDTVAAIDLDGAPLDGRELHHADLRPGATLRFRLGP